MDEPCTLPLQLHPGPVICQVRVCTEIAVYTKKCAQMVEFSEHVESSVRVRRGHSISDQNTQQKAAHAER